MLHSGWQSNDLGSMSTGEEEGWRIRHQTTNSEQTLFPDTFKTLGWTKTEFLTSLHVTLGADGVWMEGHMLGSRYSAHTSFSFSFHFLGDT